MKIYTKTGDDGTTGLFYGGRVSKDDLGPEAYGTVDEAVAALGVARAQADDALSERLITLQRDLFVVGAEMATADANRSKLVPERSLVTSTMVDRLEAWIDELETKVGLPDTFVVPGQAPVPAALDLARTVIRRAERRAVALIRDTGIEDSEVVRYLNRLADYVYMLARANEQEWEPSRPDKEPR